MVGKKEKITKDMTFAQVFKKYPKLAETFFKHGLMCIGCPFATQETLEQGAITHGLDPEKFIEELNKKLKKKK